MLIELPPKGWLILPSSPVALVLSSCKGEHSPPLFPTFIGFPPWAVVRGKNTTRQKDIPSLHSGCDEP